LFSSSINEYHHFPFRLAGKGAERETEYERRSTSIRVRRPGKSMLLLRNGDINMLDLMMQAAMTTWAAKDLPARLLAVKWQSC
jgi:hypothetical protein